MKKKTPRPLALHRETLSGSPMPIPAVGGLGTLTYEGSCGPTTCPCPPTGRERF